MVDQNYLVGLKSRAFQHVIAATVEVQGEHLVYLDALFLMEIVENWTVISGK